MIFHNRRRLGAIRRPFVGTSVYAGPTDALGVTPVSYYGLRAHSLASIGTKAVTIFRNGGSLPATQDFNTVGSVGTFNKIGGVDIDGILTFKAADGSTSLAINQWWDQVGTNHLVVQGSGPIFFQSGNGLSGNLPSIGCTTAAGNALQTAANFPTTNVPYSMYIVMNHIATTVQQNIFQPDSTGILLRASANNQAGFYDGANVLNATANDGAWNCVIGATNGTTDRIAVNASQSTGTGTSATAISGGVLLLGNLSFNSLDAFFTEAAVYSIALSSAQMTTLYGNASAWHLGAF